MTVFLIKLVHSVVFWLLTLCLVYMVYSGLTDQITFWTWVAIGLLLVETAALAAFGWRCPLRIIAERQGAERGSVTDIFLPRWFADRLFVICGVVYAIAFVLIGARLLT
ncbi:MAG: hypothetical protein ABSB75_07135 [Candidatus Limnocylindrales bacterium]|jgi:hypothetical protein